MPINSVILVCIKGGISLKKTAILVVIMILIYIFPIDVLSSLIPDSLPTPVLPSFRNIVTAQPEPATEVVDPVPEQPAPMKSYTTEYNIAGYSSMGNIIQDIIITPAGYDRTMLLTFAMHGFDGGWDKDGAFLVQIANNVIREFSEHPEELQKTRLIVVPCVNPDGIYYGKSEHGIGRCNGQGIDINRDFDYFWEYSSDSKYHTGNTPFSTPEAQILRQLVLAEKPDIVIDIHGWSNCTYGDKQIGECFNNNFGFKNTYDMTYLKQHFSGWAGQYARAVLVEYPKVASPADLNERQFSGKTIDSIKAICSLP
jgi:Predicted carboxypeptidase